LFQRLCVAPNSDLLASNPGFFVPKTSINCSKQERIKKPA
jgi:hypothetical protein